LELNLTNNCQPLTSGHKAFAHFSIWLACTPQKPFEKAFAFVAAVKEHSRAHALCLYNF